MHCGSTQNNIHYLQTALAADMKARAPYSPLPQYLLVPGQYTPLDEESDF